MSTTIFWTLWTTAGIAILISMSIVYDENGQISRVRFTDETTPSGKHWLYNVGARVLFVKDLSHSESVAVAIA